MPGDAAVFGEMLANYGADRLRRIVREGFAVLEERLAALRRVAAKPDKEAGDIEECARLLQFLRIKAFDAGFRGFADACRTHERRARRGIALAKAETEILAAGCRAARDGMERLLSDLAAEKMRHGLA
ncbi:MAG: hypothetical protein ACU0B1_04410 [Thermohalobaculum sp.]